MWDQKNDSPIGIGELNSSGSNSSIVSNNQDCSSPSEYENNERDKTNKGSRFNLQLSTLPQNHQKSKLNPNPNLNHHPNTKTAPSLNLDKYFNKEPKFQSKANRGNTSYNYSFDDMCSKSNPNLAPHPTASIENE